MRNRLVGVSALAVWLAASADAPLPEVSAEPDGAGSVLHIRNVHSQPLTAFVVEIMGYPGSQFAYRWDNDALETIAPGVVKRIAIGSMMPGTVPEYLKIRAAVYADGSTAGVASQVNGILSDRRVRLVAIRELILRIERAPTKAAAQSDLRAWSESGTTSHTSIIYALGQLKTRSREDVLVELRKVADSLAASKPSVQPR